MANNWETTVKITVPKGTNGWQQTGRVRVNGRDYKFPIGVQTQLPKPVAEYVQALIDQDKSIEEAKKRNPFSSPHQVFVTDSDGNPVWEDRTLWTALAAICPEVLSDPDVKILYDAEKTEIAAREYNGNTDIEVAYFPKVETIGDYAFTTSKIKVAIFPNVVKIGQAAFRNCTNLETVVFPKLQDCSASNAFYGCIKLQEINFPEMSGIVGGFFASNCSNLEKVSIPKVTTMSKGSEFQYCYALRDIDLPELTNVSSSPFEGLTALKKLDFPKLASLNSRALTNSGVETLILRGATVCTLSGALRAGTPIADGTGYIYVPAALIDSYKTAANWSTYAAQFRAIEDYPEICDPTMDEPITKGEAAALIDSKLEGAGGGDVVVGVVNRAYYNNTMLDEALGATGDEIWKAISSGKQAMIYLDFPLQRGVVLCTGKHVGTDYENVYRFEGLITNYANDGGEVDRRDFKEFLFGENLEFASGYSLLSYGTVLSLNAVAQSPATNNFTGVNTFGDGCLRILDSNRKAWKLVVGTDGTLSTEAVT